MNEDLIEKLDNQAWEYAVDNSNGIYNDGRLSERKRNRFAELLIRECINEIHGANLGDLPAASYYLDKVSEHIEKHFGLNDE